MCGQLQQVDPTLAAHKRVLRSMPGCGKVLARELLAELPELGRPNRWNVVSL